jgi:hypothetical protein
MMWHTTPLVDTDFCSSKIEASIHLDRIEIDDFSAQPERQLDTEVALTRCSRPYNCWDRRRGTFDQDHGAIVTTGGITVNFRDKAIAVLTGVYGLPCAVK